MPDSPEGPDLAYSASLVLRIGGAAFVACPDERHQAVYYRVDAGVRAVWRHLRGSEIDPDLVSAAEKANRKLGEQAAALTVPEEFVTGFRDLAAASLGQLARGESVSRQELSTRAVETVGFLERDLGSATGAVDFERSCQATTESLLEGWGDDPSATLRRVRRETDVWALAYQRYVRPELGQYHG